ncbi:ATP-binding protein [Shuttleworthella sp. MSX8B]|uniref:ATP-binding protein n=1 Tax=Shuttleworthella sp. MSX8B TaxID=936574 RepID=UPI000A06C3BF
MQEFTHQDHKSGRFIETPEYPEFPWYEGIINAVAHRDWAATGQFIKVSMYDDRLEIESPGRFSDIVTSDNISCTRFSRNKRISRVMTEFEWGREKNSFRYGGCWTSGTGVYRRFEYSTADPSE